MMSFVAVVDAVADLMRVDAAAAAAGRMMCCCLRMM